MLEVRPDHQTAHESVPNHAHVGRFRRLLRAWIQPRADDARRRDDAPTDGWSGSTTRDMTAMNLTSEQLDRHFRVPGHGLAQRPG
jgi:hypothetical protein